MRNAELAAEGLTRSEMVHATTETADRSKLIPRTGSRLAFATTITTCVALGLFIWSIFRPGVIDYDALQQMEEAKTGHLRDWFSFVMTGALRLALLAGRGIGTLTLVQSVAGCLGVYGLACAVLEHVFQQRIAESTRRYLSLGALLLLLTPFSPLLYYLVWFRNDTWTAILLVWSGVAWLRLERATDSRQQCRWAVTALFLAVGVCLVRHNAVALLPIFCLLFLHSLSRTSGIAAAATVLALLIAYPVSSRGVAHLFQVKRSHPEMQIMALDLVGLCVEDERLRGKLPFTNANLVSDRYKTAYVPGWVGPVDGFAEVNCAKSGYSSYRVGLVHDYRIALRHCPAKLVGVKLRAFAAMLFDPNAHWHYADVHPNTFHLAFNARFEYLRGTLGYFDQSVRRDSFLAFFCARHLPWLAVAIVAVFFTGSIYLMGRSRRWLTSLLLLLVPLAYYFSYLAGVPAHDYRYMYPATLIIQVVTIALVLGHICIKMKNFVADT